MQEVPFHIVFIAFSTHNGLKRSHESHLKVKKRLNKCTFLSFFLVGTQNLPTFAVYY